MNEEMTDYQFETLLKMLNAIIRKCKTLDEAKEEIRKLLKESYY